MVVGEYGRVRCDESYHKHDPLMARSEYSISGTLSRDPWCMASFSVERPLDSIGQPVLSRPVCSMSDFEPGGAIGSMHGTDRSNVDLYPR